jgi:hypothetical protein
MMSSIRVTTNGGYFADRFARYLARQIQVSRLTVEQVVRREAKGVIKHAFKLTPPMAGRSFAKGFSASRKAIKSTVQRALVMRNEATVQRSLQTVRREARRAALQELAAELAVPPATLVQFIKQNQKPDKRYPDAAPRHFSTVEKRKAVIAMLERTIGATAAGWCRAALALGITVPDWITRWQGRNTGSVSFSMRGNVVEFKAKNPNRHTDSAHIQRALDSAYGRQAESIRRQLVQAIARGVLRREDVFGR